MKIFYDFGAYNVETSWTSVLTLISPYFLAIGTGGLCLWIFLRAVQKRDSSPFLPKKVIFLTVVLLGLTFGTFKMFSPQFLLLMVPIISVVPLRGIALLGFCTVFSGACCTSTFIYPYFYVKEILQGPTPFGLFLLAARELMVLTLPAVGIAMGVVGKLGIIDLHRFQADSLPVADAPCPNHPQ
jgi:phosphoglycerol transferase MdoB-like AlkP superfamily enzyme